MVKKLHGYNGVRPIIPTINFSEIAVLPDAARRTGCKATSAEV